MSDITKRRAGLLFGSFTADALSLGVHWIYDCEELAKKFGPIDRYYAAGAGSYHPKKLAGAQGHVGDQALTLAESLKKEMGWDPSAYMKAWIDMWPEYQDYIDHATKTTLQNIEGNNEPTLAASHSEELAGPARIAPLIAFLIDQTENDLVEACIQQTRLTHDSELAIESTRFIATASFQLTHGAELLQTLEDTAPEWAFKKATSVLKNDAVEAISELGQSCSIQAALPSVIYLALKYGSDLPTAFTKNAMAGGDNCARALVLGMLLGAQHGIDAIPKDWIDSLAAKPLLDSLLS